MNHSRLKGSVVNKIPKDLQLLLQIAVLIYIQSTVLGQKFIERHQEFRHETFLRRKLTKDGLIPEIVGNPPAHAPEFLFVSGAMADFGNKVRPEDVFEAPRVVRLNCEPEDLFTILMTDYDASTRLSPRKREWLHWAMGNCKGENLLEGDTLAPFSPLKPKKSTGLHRYIFFVFKQPEKIKFREKFSNRSETGRKNFSTRDFAQKYDLGNVYGINYFISEWVSDEDKDPYDS